MDMSKYEQIDGRKALKRLLDGEDVFMEMVSGTAKLKLGEYGLRGDFAGYENQVIYWTFNQIYMSKELYIPKPFDVREAMRESPGKWVGKYKDGDDWWEVGFDERHFNVIAKPSDKHLPVDTSLTGVTFPSPDHLDKCIPVDELVKEES